MTQEIEIVLLPEEKDDELLLKQKAALALKIALNRIQSVQIRKRSIDARSRQVVFRVKLIVAIDEALAPEIFTVNYPSVTDKKPVLIVGAGPAGSSAAIYCNKLGLNTLLLDRSIFPRDKICGDALSGKSVKILEELDLLQDLDKLGANMTLDNALTLIFCGIEDGYRASKQECELTIDDLADLIDTDFNVIGEAMKILTNHMGSNSNKKKQKAKRK